MLSCIPAQENNQTNQKSIWDLNSNKIYINIIVVEPTTSESNFFNPQTYNIGVEVKNKIHIDREFHVKWVRKKWVFVVFNGLWAHYFETFKCCWWWCWMLSWRWSFVKRKHNRIIQDNSNSMRLRLCSLFCSIRAPKNISRFSFYTRLELLYTKDWEILQIILLTFF